MAPELVKYAEQLDFDEITNCMRCGFCLPACPTYRETGLEIASPRGRISLMKGLATGELEPSSEVDDAMYLCLGCRACETACPAGVKYGRLIEGAREVMEATQSRSPFVRAVKNLTLKSMFPHPQRMYWLGSILGFLQDRGFLTWMKRARAWRLLPTSMRDFARALPDVAGMERRRQRLSVVPALGERRLRVGLFTGCIMDAVFYETNQNTAKVLSAAGCEVVIVPGQACCGALHAHIGDKDGAKELAKRNIEAFEEAHVDVYVNNAGGCGAALKEYEHWFEGDLTWSARARRFVEATKDFNELLAELPMPKLRSLEMRVTYQDSCHLAHGQGVRSQPRDLLRAIPGLTFVELPEADRCCGSAGIYNLTQSDMSMQILDGKMTVVSGTMAEVVVTSNPGCLLQMRTGIVRAGLETQMQAVHIADLLAQALPSDAGV